MHSAASSKTSGAPPGSRARTGYTTATHPREGDTHQQAARAPAATNAPPHPRAPAEAILSRAHLAPSWGATPIRPASAQLLLEHGGGQRTAAQADGSGGRPLHLALRPSEAPPQQTKSAITIVAIVPIEMVAIVRIQLPHLVVSVANPYPTKRVAVLRV